MRRFVLAAFFAFVALPSPAAERWQTLPPTPTPIATDRGGEVDANGIKIHCVLYGQGSARDLPSRRPCQRRLLGQPG